MAQRRELPESPGAVAAEPSPRPSLAAGLVRTARPKQWLKNVLVFAAPGAAGVLTEAEPLARSLAAFAAFCLAASGTYYLNDSLDHEADRAHPKKRHRPIAAGVVPLGLGYALGAALLAASVVAALLTGGGDLAVVVGTYVALTLAYSLWLKHQPVLDIGAVAAGFVLRTIAGGVAVDVPISEWFIIVASFGSLFMVSGKRSAEFDEMGEQRATTRVTLSLYTASFLRYVRGVTSAVAIAAYCLWAFERAEGVDTALWFELSIVPFVLGIMRYALLLETGHGGAPEEVVLGDRTLQAIGVAWAIVFAVGIYGA